MKRWVLKVYWIFLGIHFFAHLVLAGSKSLSTLLTEEEEKYLQTRVLKFYGSEDPSLMNQNIPKTNPLDGSPRVRKHPDRELGGSGRSRLLKKRTLKNGKMGTWSSAGDGDKVSELLETYFTSAEITYQLDDLLNQGEVSGDYWSGDYWNMNWGLTSYRYSSGKKFKLYKRAVEAYSQPQEWIKLWESLSLANISDAVILWSPSEKYDLLVGDEKFTLTREQKAEGADLIGKDGKVESWFGICDGWSTASIFVPSPQKPVTTLGASGISITWYPDDIRALASLAWTNGDYDHNFVGRRCDSLKPKLYPNGRISEAECADTNPATFHLALGLMLGKKRSSFIMDASFDAEVWNQPILAYEYKYFNPLNPRQRSGNWRDVMVPYDESFKKKDRFQKPLTRGYKRDGQYFDGGVRAIVAVETTVVYLTEYAAQFDEKPQENVTERVTYTYDLELHEKEGELIAKGGEWHSNLHPDFLWVPKRNEVSREKWDDKNLKVDLSSIPNEKLSELASKASKAGYPLCSAVEALVNASSDGSRTYRCFK